MRAAQFRASSLVPGKTLAVAVGGRHVGGIGKREPSGCGCRVWVTETPGRGEEQCNGLLWSLAV
jgi:hypothetical protein